jgi:N-acetylglutamate synthase-like GNAT family acetyltransferase
MTSQSPPATIRNATQDDLVEIEALLDPYVQQRKLLPRTTSELGELIKHGFVAEALGKIVGFAALNIYSKKLAEVQCLAVVADFQRQGIGKRLVEACVQRAREQEVLEVLAITSTEHFMMACGFNFALPGERKALFFQTREH